MALEINRDAAKLLIFLDLATAENMSSGYGCLMSGVQSSDFEIALKTLEIDVNFWLSFI